jgi:disease resistance protein RPM1
MVFDKEMLQKATVPVIFAKFKLLTSLDFEDCPIDHLPKELGNLLHIRYLNLRNTDVKELPRSIGRLHNLESLDLRFSLVEELPVEISDFPKLQHLLAHGGYATGLKIKGSFEHLEFLQTLFTIKVDDDVSLLNDGLQVLTKTRKFGICNLRREQGRYLCTVLEKMTCLRSLLVYSVNHQVEILDLESEFSPPIQLQRLWLGGQLDRLPNWISKLHNLSKLILSFSSLMDDSVEVLQALPNLKSLVLLWAYNGERMHFEGGGFQKLKSLYLAGLDYLKEMLIEEGALPLLERLEIGACPMLKEVPTGLQNLRYLEVLSFASMTKEFNQRWSQQESKISRHVRIHRSDGTCDKDDKASFEAWEKRKFGAWEKRRFG